MKVANPVKADIRVHGPAQLLSAFRKRLVEAMREESGAPALREDHTNEALRFHAVMPDGIPFPTLISLSTRYPDCVAIVTWNKGSASGETTIQNGQVKEASRGANPSGVMPVQIELADDRSLQLAMALDLQESGLCGYCANSAAETWFRIEGDQNAPVLYTIDADPGFWDEKWIGGQCVPLSPPLPTMELDRKILGALAERLRAEWLWFDHAPMEETIVERHRFNEAGRPIHAINVKSIKLAEHADRIVSGIAPDHQWVVALLRNTWGHQARS